jgi:hypothetical protein
MSIGGPVMIWTTDWHMWQGIINAQHHYHINGEQGYLLILPISCSCNLMLPHYGIALRLQQGLEPR